jgi:hypothetical protein
MHGQVIRGLIMVLGLTAGCTPAERLAAGGTVAVLGLTTSAVGVGLVAPCLGKDDHAEYDACRATREPVSSEQQQAGATVFGVGLAVMAIGGILALTGVDQSRQSQPAVRQQ